MLFHERRRHPRYGCTGPADVMVMTDSPLVSARVVNVSKGGCLIEMHRSLHFERDVTAELAFIVNRLPFRMRVQVAGMRSATAVGLQFALQSERAKWQLEELIDELAADWRKRLSARRLSGD